MRGQYLQLVKEQNDQLSQGVASGIVDPNQKTEITSVSDLSKHGLSPNSDLAGFVKNMGPHLGKSYKVYHKPHPAWKDTPFHVEHTVAPDAEGQTGPTIFGHSFKRDGSRRSVEVTRHDGNGSIIDHGFAGESDNPDSDHAYLDAMGLSKQE